MTPTSCGHCEEQSNGKKLGQLPLSWKPVIQARTLIFMLKINIQEKRMKLEFILFTLWKLIPKA